jgi:hypothetical protein
MSKTFVVNYEGWLLIEATDEQAAATAANEILSSSNIINDGGNGEWYLGEIEEDN